MTRATVPPFGDALAQAGRGPLHRGPVRTVQANVGLLCNQACHHCHVEAGPKRTEVMSAATADRLLDLLARSSGVRTLDLTGGAPELNPSFPRLVRGSRALGLDVMVRCNLTVLFEPGMEHLPGLYREAGVHLVCSLPCYTADNVDAQRGRGVFDRSIEALRLLDGLGYGRRDDARLDLVYNPTGPFLPPDQATLEARYREELGRLFGLSFHRLLTITNMPIRRFAHQLARDGEHERYMGLLVSHFNAATLDDLMCLSMASVSWDGFLHDCDFHQMEGIALTRAGAAQDLWSIESFDELEGTAVAVADHCYGCTAGAGSSCGGALSAAPAA